MLPCKARLCRFLPILKVFSIAYCVTSLNLSFQMSFYLPTPWHVQQLRPRFKLGTCFQDNESKGLSDSCLIIILHSTLRLTTFRLFGRRTRAVWVMCLEQELGLMTICGCEPVQDVFTSRLQLRLLLIFLKSRYICTSNNKSNLYGFVRCGSMSHLRRLCNPFSGSKNAVRINSSYCLYFCEHGPTELGSVLVDHCCSSKKKKGPHFFVSEKRWRLEQVHGS